MQESITRKFSTTLTQVIVPFEMGGPTEPKCAACGASLDVEQPSLQVPDRLLGVCGECGSWAIFELMDSGGVAWVTVLPRELWPGRVERPTAGCEFSAS